MPGVGSIIGKVWDAWKLFLAEFLGTLFLVLVGCGSTVPKDASNLGIALCFGLSVGVIVHGISHISGGHINPAVTVGMLIAGNISILNAIIYIIAQLLGAVAGAAILFVLLPNDAETRLGITGVSGNISEVQGVAIEFLITFLLVFTIFMVLDPRKNVSRHEPMVIGFCVAMCHIWAIKFTGSSMNTARSFGPALIGNTWTNHWIYWVGPLLGGVVASLLYRFVFAIQAEDIVPEEPA